MNSNSDLNKLLDRLAPALRRAAKSTTDRPAAFCIGVATITDDCWEIVSRSGFNSPMALIGLVISSLAEVAEHSASPPELVAMAQKAMRCLGTEVTGSGTTLQ